MILYKQVENLTREFNINYKACIGSLIYILSTILYLSFSVHKLEMFSSNNAKVNSEVLVHFLIYIRYNKTLGLNYYSKMNDATLSKLMRQAGINTENQLIVFSDYSRQY